MSYLFLSYAKADRESAKSIKTLLEKTGCAVWMDENPRELTDEQWPIIEGNIFKAAGFVLLVSEDAKKSDWLQRELTYAESLQKAIFPILISGTDWPRLLMPADTLEFGLSLDLPDSLKEKLTALGLSPLPLELPAQIPAHTIDYKRGRAKKSFVLWLGIMAAMIAIVVIFAPFILGGIDNQENARETDFRYSVTLTAEGRQVDSTETRNGFIVQRTSESATNQAVREGNRQTRTQEQRDEHHTATALSSTRQVALVQERIRQTNYLQLTATQEYQLNETAIAGGGTLPCDATVVMENGVSRVTLYRSPSLTMGTASLSRAGGEVQEFVITEWIVNEDGSWYRVGTSSLSSMGYVLAEELVLDESCPR